MSLNQITAAKRYAKALFELLSEQDELDRGYAELNQIRQVFIANPDLSVALTDQSLSQTKRQTLMNPLLEGTSGVIHNLVLMVYDYHRMDIMVEIINQFQSLYDEHRQTVYAKAITAVPLNEDEMTRLKDAYAKRVGAKEVVLSNQVDATIIGGVIVKSKGTILDGSIQTKINRLRQALLG